ncbi:TPA: MobP2 family relaxase [Enterococcus faecium]
MGDDMTEHIFNRKSASIILKAKFETGKNKKKNHMVELQKFVDYISRQEAIRQDKLDHDYSEDELNELARIEKALEKIEQETDQPVIKDLREMDKYIDYMTRKKAILENVDNEIVNGAFSNTKRYITKKDISKIKESVIEAKNNGSVMFQDVISFDNDFLVREGYYNPETNELNENILYEATKSMMGKMQEKEELVDPFWFATIHRNTEHIHIHVTAMERKNTREIMEYDGVLQARGKRKQSTLDDMIFKFGSKILDRTNEFEKISKLRKEVPLELKQSVKDSLIQLYVENNSRYDKELVKYLKELKKEIPSTTRGYNELPEETKEKIDEVTNYMTKDNPKRKEYDRMTKEIDELYQTTYGKRYNPQEYYLNRKKDFNARMGNAVVGQIKLLKQSEEKNLKSNELKNLLDGKKLNVKFDREKPEFKTKYAKQSYDDFQKRLEERQLAREKNEVHFKKISEKFKDKKLIRKIDRVINDDLNMYRAKNDYEVAQRMIEQEKMRQAREFEIGMN